MVLLEQIQSLCAVRWSINEWANMSDQTTSGLRHQYLDQQWRRYPEVTSESLTRGVRFGRWRDFMSESGLKLEASALSPSEILISEDIVSVEKQTVMLLAPALKNNPFSIATGMALRWSQFQSQIRSYFLEKQFVEMNTPTLVICPGTEPFLQPFRTDLIHGKKSQPLTLVTSPELHLKKLITMGFSKIFELKSCFRNGEFSDHHEPEFTMLEWYRAYNNLSAIQTDVIDLFKYLGVSDAIVIKKMSELFKDYAGVEITPEMSIDDWRRLAQKCNVDTASDDSIDEIFHRVFLEKIETRMPAQQVLIVTDFPPFLAAYSRLNNQGWADRFEVYYQGLEIANAFHEVNDPEVQRQRMQLDLNKKHERGLSPVSLDEEFFDCLESGFPPTGGIALGVERLFMAIHGIKRMKDFKIFTYERYFKN